MKAEKNLKIYSILFIVLAGIDIATLLFQAIGGELAKQAAVVDASIEIQNAAIIISCVIVSIVALIKLFIGIKGLLYSKGKSNKTGFITFMKVILGLEAIGLVFNCFSKTGLSVSNILTSIINILIIIYFIKYAEEVKKSRK